MADRRSLRKQTDRPGVFSEPLETTFLGHLIGAKELGPINGGLRRERLLTEPVYIANTQASTTMEATERAWPELALPAEE